METLHYRVPAEDAFAERPYVPISRSQLNVGFILVTIVLSAASYVVVVTGAHAEPYMVYDRDDAIVQIGVATALIALWGCFALAVGVLAATRKVAVGWLALLLWAAVCVLYLGNGVTGYLGDLENNILPASGGG